MKPLTLRMKNFGPYQDAIVDFTQFHEVPLYLITGKTGSGKTTIFDGMCYALYGETTSGLRQGKEMRANYADPKEKTEVSLTFEHGGLRYEIVREPEQVLQKKKGEGTTNKAAKVVWTVFNAEGEEIQQKTKNNEVKEAVEELLHLTASQFTQIILLPQGEFRKFLNADSNKKEQVLRKLFDTAMYGEIGDYLKEQKKSLTKNLEQEEQQLALLYEQVVFDEEHQAESSELSAIEERMAFILTQNQCYSQQEEQEKVSQKKLKEQQDKLSQRYFKEEQLLKDFQQQQTLKESLTKLVADNENIEQLAEEVVRLRWLESLKHPLMRYKELEEVQRGLRSSMEEKQKEQEQTAVLKREAEIKLTTLQEQAPQMKAKEEQVQRLMNLVPLAQERAVLEEKINVAKASVADKQKEQADYLIRIETLTANITEMQQKIAQESQLLREEGQLSETLRQIQEAQELVEHYQQIDVQRQTEQQELEKLENRLEGEKRQFEATTQAFLEQKSLVAKMQIARLSLHLLPGEPCPVCGATEHPQMTQAEHSWSMEEIRTAEEELEGLEAQQTDSQKTLVQLEERVESLTRSLKQTNEQLAQQQAKMHLSQKSLDASFSDLEVTDKDWQIQLATSFENYQEKKRGIQQDLENIGSLREQLTGLQEQLVSIEEEKQVLSMVVEELERTKLEARAALEQIDKQIPIEWQGLDLENLLVTYQEEVNSWQQQVEKQGKLLRELEQTYAVVTNTLQNLTEQLAKNQQASQQQQEELQQVFQTSDYAESSVDYYIEELEHLPLLAEYEERIKQHGEEKTRLTLQLEQLEEKIGQQTLPNITQTKSEQVVIAEQLQEVEGKIVKLSHWQEQNHSLHDQIATKYGKLKEQLQLLGELNQLSEVMNGDGPLKISMERYVLQVYFSEVLRVANQKLMQLTNNRYSFELKEEQGSYKKSTGLEINIYDDNVGAVRSVNTLSGGESFIAALSLSLALGEVVQSQTGAVQIDAMFIDEGFGSLDEDSLEMAINALEMVEGKGRSIGIISHVRELKERIFQQIQVVALGTGQSRISYQLVGTEEE